MVGGFLPFLALSGSDASAELLRLRPLQLRLARQLRPPIWRPSVGRRPFCVHVHAEDEMPCLSRAFQNETSIGGGLSQNRVGMIPVWLVGELTHFRSLFEWLDWLFTG